MKVSVSKETEQKTFSIEASGIKTVEDVKEVIRQCQLVEGQITDGLFQITVGEFNLTNDAKSLSREPLS